MKRLAFLLIAVLMVVSGVGNAGEMQVPGGTFVFSDDANYFGRMTVTRTGAFTGTLRDAFDDFEFGKRTFRGQISVGGEVECILHIPQATYYHPYGPYESFTIRHTPGGPTEYAATVKLVVGNRIGPPTVYTYELPGYHLLEDSEAAGYYTLLLRRAPEARVGVPPEGTGWAVLRLSAAGSFQCLGRLATNESFSIGFDARADRKLDLFRMQSPSTYYPRRGGKFRSIFYGTIQLRDVADESDADGLVTWDDDTLRNAEFSTDLTVLGSRYVPTRDAFSLLASGAPPEEGPLGVATFSLDAFPSPKTAQFRFGSQPVVLPASRPLLLQLGWTTQGTPFPGRFRGRVRPDGAPGYPFSGVFFSKQRTAEGFFMIGSNSGVVTMGVEPP